MLDEEAHGASDVLIVVLLAEQTLLAQVVLQEEKAPVDVNSDKRYQFEVEQFGLEVEQEWAALKDVLEYV